MLPPPNFESGASTSSAIPAHKGVEVYQSFAEGQSNVIICPMKKSDFYFDLPAHLIAQYPTEKRSGSRLLVVQGDGVQDKQFPDFYDLVEPGDLLVFNDTKVFPARLFGQKASGGKVEVLVERLLDEHTFIAHVRASKTPQIGSSIRLEDGFDVEMLGREGDLFKLKNLSETPLLTLFEQYGHIPLPPYIVRDDANEDKQRYQTVYAKNTGAVAAPTAGLHFDEALMERLKAKGAEFGFVTLHVGAGTFQPLRVDNILEHKMHAEYIEVSEAVCDQIKATKARGNRVIAIGTTTVRCLETAASDGTLKPYYGDTQIFIYPPYQFKCVDALLTNFHLPESTLLMLVSAFAGYENIMNAYKFAIEHEYRFFSYGDAMFIK